MKRLTGIRLINWHAFKDEKIDIEDSTLLSGENGAGKSTILDAIQYVLTCSKNNFNKAANENSKRNLAGYVRFKTGLESKEYERTGNITAHVALEFYEEKKDSKFVIGAVIDSASETSEKELLYRAEKTSLDDITFINDDEPVDIANFKVYGRKLKMQFFTRKIDAKKDFSNKLGRLNEKFFDLFPKALAFKPISNVKEFVYTYILEEKEVNIEALRENIRIYKEFEELLEEVKIKIFKLKEIRDKYYLLQSTDKTIKTHQYIVLLAEEESLKNDIENKLLEIDKLEIKIDSLIKEKNNLDDDIEDKNKTANNLQADLLANTQYRAVNELKEKLAFLSRRYRDENENKNSFIKLLESQKGYLRSLKEFYNNDSNLENLYLSITNITEENLESYKEVSIETEKYIDKIKCEEEKARAEKDYELKQKIKDKNELEKRKLELEKRNLQYPINVVKLKDEIIKESSKLGRRIEPKILCELLEVNDDLWKNAVEGYLNTQRFYFLVEEDEFDTVLRIYERAIKTKGIHSVGIINTRGLEKYDTPKEEGSLAEVVTAKSINAKRFINMILGNVIRCNHSSELKKYKTSITSSCLVYKNNVARAMDKKIYETPYIGADAYKIQLEQTINILNSVNYEIEKIKLEFSRLDKIITSINKLKLETLREKSDVLKVIRELRDKIDEINKSIKELEKNNTYIDIQIKYDNLQKEIKKLKEKKNNIDESIISLKGIISGTERVLHEKRENLAIKKQILAACEEEIGDLKISGLERFKKEKVTKDLSVIVSNFNMSKKRNETLYQSQYEELKEKQTSYNITYDLGAEIGIGGIKVFLDTLETLEKSKVIEYEDKVKSARDNAEEEFREHFLSRIQENISNAKEEFKELNRGLRDVKFGKEKYEFKIGKSKENKEYYDMIMDTENIGEGFTLFSTSFEDKNRELLNELFEKLTLDNESNELELMKLTDYRNYMSYDIEIKYDNEKTAYFSKVCKEKSGGETQTPFYVAMAASFLQLYKGTYSANESIGLILFDEAFDKMDDARIMAMMEFYSKLDLQLIVAAPPQKIEPITPYVKTILLAIKDDDCSFIERMVNENNSEEDNYEGL